MKHLFLVLCVCFELLTCGYAVAYNPTGVTLGSISIQSPTNIWVAGYEATGAPLISRWNGKNFRTPSDIPRLDEYVFTAVSVSDLWIIGAVRSGASLIPYHYEGSRWINVPGPANSSTATINAIAAESSSDIWAVGQDNNKTFTMHWNGRIWTRVPSLNTTEYFNNLSTLTVVSSSNVWATGVYGSNAKPLVEHWNGHAWSIVHVPGRSINAIAAESSSDIWAVGDSTLEHWNGHTWEAFSDPYTLSALAIVSSSDIWAVGNGVRCNDNGCSPPYTVVEHWNGYAWSIVSSVTPYSFLCRAYTGELLAVHAFSTGNVWALGQSCGKIMLQSWDGHIWKLIYLESI